MKRRRALMITNLAALLVLLIALLAGWREAAGFGLVVLLVLDLMVLIRERPSMSKDEPEK